MGDDAGATGCQVTVVGEGMQKVGAVQGLDGLGINDAHGPNHGRRRDDGRQRVGAHKNPIKVENCQAGLALSKKKFGP
jgi:hypothetical protein